MTTAQPPKLPLDPHRHPCGQNSNYNFYAELDRDRRLAPYGQPDAFVKGADVTVTHGGHRLSLIHI